jgi:hypothetical protein
MQHAKGKPMSEWKKIGRQAYKMGIPVHTCFTNDTLANEWILAGYNAAKAAQEVK